jgi:hypothetical protein
MAYSFGSKKEAAIAASKLVKRLRGKGWKTYVFENMGWFASAVNRNIRVSVNPDGEYHCLMNDHSKHKYSGSCLWTPASNAGTDPNVLVMTQISIAANVVERLCKVVDETSVACGLQAQFKKKSESKTVE